MPAAAKYLSHWQQTLNNTNKNSGCDNNITELAEDFCNLPLVREELRNTGNRHGSTKDVFDVDSGSAVVFLKRCTQNKDLHGGTVVHADILKRGFLGQNPVVASALVSMYTKCGSLVQAKEVLDGLLVHDVSTWNTLIIGYVQAEEAKQALSCFDQMQCEGISPDAITFSCILKACGSIGELDKGEYIYLEVVKLGLLHGNAVLGSSVVDMYAKCGALEKSKQVLMGLPTRSIVSWNALISGYVQCNHGKEALECFDQMQQEGLFPDAVTILCILKACGRIRALEKGNDIHCKIITQGWLDQNVALGNALVDMYAKCGAMAKAKEVLIELPVRSVVSWSALIWGYAQGEYNKEALECFELMQREGISPDAVIFLALVKACGNIASLNVGQKVHLEIIRKGLLAGSTALGNAVVDMYTKCGALTEAREVLDGLLFRDVVAWSVLIAGYVQADCGKEGLNCFEQMQHEGLSANVVTFVCVLKACASIGALEKGKNIHLEIVRQQLLARDVTLCNALVDMYAKCGMPQQAKEVLDGLPVHGVISWSTLIAGYAQVGCGERALNCFERMQHEGICPNAVTYICALKGCGIIRSLEKGMHIHAEIGRQGLLHGDVMLGNSLASMYAKCGALTKSKEVLKGLPFCDVISWSILIAGYVHGEHWREALDCFEDMQREGFSPSVATLLCILKACGNIGALDKGQVIHSEMVSQGLLHGNVILGNALVYMYAKCGALAKAKEVLEGLPFQDVVSWNALIGGLAHGEHCKEALKCFEQMQCDGLVPDEITFLSLISACSHSGLSWEGWHYYIKMIHEYGISPDFEHQTCIVDLFARAGLLDKAVAVFLSPDDPPVWLALLGACRKWGNIKVGSWAFRHALQQDTSSFIA